MSERINQIAQRARERYRKRHGRYPNSSTMFRTKKKIGRNEPCYCGSNKKYKKCCLNKET